MENVKVELKRFMEARGLGLRGLGQILGYAPSTLCDWMNGHYDGNSARIDEIASQFLERQMETINAPEKAVPFVMTSVAKRVFEVARIAHIDREIGVCYGPAGVGKTAAIKEYARVTPNSILIEADLGHTAKALFSELHGRLGLEGFGTVHGMFGDIVTRLRGSDTLLIVDEAEHLPYKALELLRRVHDKAGVGILLAGMPRLIHNLRGKKGEYAQLYSRIGIAVRLEPLKERDTQMIVESSLPGSNGIWKTLHETSQGNARALGKLILRSKRVAELNGVPITPEIVRETARLLII